MIQELYETLENKQRQIMRLGKMVKLMEEQQDRAQAQRTRFENRIAQLELIIQRSKEQRYVREKSSPKYRVDSEQDTLQDYYSDSERVLLQNSRSIPLQNNFVYDYENGGSRQTSSDEDQPYICERCRREIETLDQDDSDDNSLESLRDWSKNENNLEIMKDSIDGRDFHDDDYLRDSPLIKNRKYSSMMCSLHGESDNVDDSSRELHYQKEYHQRLDPLRHRFRPSPNRTESHDMNL